MLAPRHRYYAFVTRFVDAIVTEPVAQELTRLRHDRLRRPTTVPSATAPTALDTRKAA